MLTHYLKGYVVVNDAKTLFSSKAHNRHVTGITLTNNGDISVGRKRKRFVSSMIHKFTLGELPAEDLSYLQGLISFVIDVEPDFKGRMVRKYSLAVVESIIRGGNEKE